MWVLLQKNKPSRKLRKNVGMCYQIHVIKNQAFNFFSVKEKYIQSKNIYWVKRSEIYIILTESNFAYKHIQDFKANQSEDRKSGCGRCLLLLFSSCSLLLLQSLGDSLKVWNDKCCASVRNTHSTSSPCTGSVAGDMLQVRHSKVRCCCSQALIWRKEYLY